jgi:hypothetical protein
MTKNSQLLRYWVMDSIANDYENFEMVVSETGKFAEMQGMQVDQSAIIKVLRQLIDDGDAQVYVFSGTSHLPTPADYAVDRLEDLWFYLTPKGNAALSSGNSETEGL